jgi:hypothetical protein
MHNFMNFRGKPMSTMNKLAGALSLAAITLSTGCASIVSGNHQPVSVETGAVKNASCSLVNNKGTWFVPNTPGSVVVNRSFDEMNVTCQKTGYRTSIVKIGSSTKPMAFGNIVFGGVIGAGVDMADGAAYDYPTIIQVPMKRA